MGIIKFKLIFIISSLVLALLPVNAMANTLQPGQNFNNENNEQQNDYTESSEEGNWTEPEESYDNSGNNNNFNNNNNNNYNNDENYYDNNNYNNENNYNNDEGNWETQQEPAEQYEEPAQQEPVIEEPVEPETQYEEPVEEAPIIEEPVEVEEPEPSVDVNTLDAEVFSISGEAADEDGEGVEGIELILNGESFDEQSVTTDEDGRFLFEEVQSGDYQIEIKPTEEYEVSEPTMELEVTDRSKRGLEINLTEAAEEESEPSEPVTTEEEVMAAETSSLSSMDWTLIGTGIVFALISLFVLLFKRVRNN
ncbi:carboxypeptidase-like regulatory domain-containing protein [Salinicoccus sp. YB14-2]|uniref:carboxypeptidase-like regulatory domain-containing protein n=1 Tax=Salinicoccus sp. YB14-2 TaxID=1572701 RepID=UPI00068BF8D4|nr:carboxypeptidase-like regulatory domain-containing protein [Salinicoccus sp. YB14-2]